MLRGYHSGTVGTIPTAYPYTKLYSSLGMQPAAVMAAQTTNWISINMKHSVHRWEAATAKFLKGMIRSCFELWHGRLHSQRQCQITVKLSWKFLICCRIWGFMMENGCWHDTSIQSSILPSLSFCWYHKFSHRDNYVLDLWNIYTFIHHFHWFGLIWCGFDDAQ